MVISSIRTKPASAYIIFTTQRFLVESGLEEDTGSPPWHFGGILLSCTPFVTLLWTRRRHQKVTGCPFQVIFGQSCENRHSD